MTPEIAVRDLRGVCGHAQATAPALASSLVARLAARASGGASAAVMEKRSSAARAPQSEGRTILPARNSIAQRALRPGRYKPASNPALISSAGPPARRRESAPDHAD